MELILLYIYLVSVVLALILGYAGNKTLGPKYETPFASAFIPILNVFIVIILTMFLLVEFVPKWTKWYYKKD